METAKEIIYYIIAALIVLIINGLIYWGLFELAKWVWNK